MAKLFFLLVFFILSLSGCAGISGVGVNVVPDKSYPGLFQCEGKEQQRAIMTGDRPYWGADTGTPSDSQDCKKER